MFFFLIFILGCEDVSLCRIHIRDIVGSLPRHASLQHVQCWKPIHGPLVPHVCQDLHLHELVSVSLLKQQSKLHNLQQYNCFFLFATI